MFDFRKYLPPKNAQFDTFLGVYYGFLRYNTCSIEQLFVKAFDETNPLFVPIVRLDTKHILFPSVMMMPANTDQLVYANEYTELTGGESCTALVHVKIVRSHPYPNRIEVAVRSGKRFLLDIKQRHYGVLTPETTYVLEIETYKRAARSYIDRDCWFKKIKKDAAHVRLWRLRHVLFCTAYPTSINRAPSWYHLLPR